MLNKSRSNKTTFFGGVATLATGVIIVKIIGALYKIPLANILGDTGYSYFTTAYNIYNVLLTISTAGLPVALSRAVSQADAQKRYNQVNKVFRVALIIFLVLGSLGAAIMFFGARPITNGIGSPGAYYSVRALAPATLCVCCMASFRGYFQGHGNMAPTSISQIIEAAIKLVIGLSLAYVLARQSMELSSAGAITGVTLGTVVALCFLIVTFTRQKESRPSEDEPDSRGQIFKVLVLMAVPITISSSVTNIVYLIDNGLILNQLQNVLHMTQAQANALYGTYSAAGTLYSLPSSLMVPFTASILPAVTAAMSRKDHESASRIAESGMRVGMLIAIPAGFGLTALAGPICALLYPSYNNQVAGDCLKWLGIASIFVCIMLLSNSILQAHGKLYLPIITAVVGGVIKLVVNYSLVRIEALNVVGAAIGTLCCFGVVALLDMIIIHRVVPAPPKIRRIFIKPAIASAAMAVVAWVVYRGAAHVLRNRAAFQSVGSDGVVSLSRLGNAGAVVAAILIGIIVYAVLIIVLKVLNKDDMSLMPKGDKIAKLLRIS